MNHFSPQFSFVEGVPRRLRSRPFEPEVACPLCKKMFLSRRSVLRHIKNIHRREDYLTICPPERQSWHDRPRDRRGRFKQPGGTMDEKVQVEPETTMKNESQEQPKPVVSKTKIKFSQRFPFMNGHNLGFPAAMPLQPMTAGAQPVGNTTKSFLNSTPSTQQFATGPLTRRMLNPNLVGYQAQYPRIFPQPQPKSFSVPSTFRPRYKNHRRHYHHHDTTT